MEQIRRRWQDNEAEREGLPVHNPSIRAKGQRFIDNYIRRLSR